MAGSTGLEPPCPFPAGRLPLVGRQSELAVLMGRLADAARGVLTVVLVSGDPGIGKSRLLDEVAARAQARGYSVLCGGAVDAEGMPPYLPLIEALGAYVRAADPEVLRAQAGVHAAVLAAVLPELALRLGDLPAGYPLPPEQARLRLFEAVGVLLLTIARGGAPPGLLLVLDDLHWADAATLDLVCYVARRYPQAPLLLLGAYRPGETRRNPALERALAELVRLRALFTIPLGTLAEHEVLALAQAVLGSSVDARLGALLHAHSEGNPFFAEELLRDWFERGVVRRAPDRWTLATTADVDTAEPAVPAGIVAVVRGRLARLPKRVTALLEGAAVAGRTWPFRSWPRSSARTRGRWNKTCRRPPLQGLCSRFLGVTSASATTRSASACTWRSPPRPVPVCTRASVGRWRRAATLTTRTTLPIWPFTSPAPVRATARAASPTPCARRRPPCPPMPLKNRPPTPVAPWR